MSESIFTPCSYLMILLNMIIFISIYFHLLIHVIILSVMAVFD